MITSTMCTVQNRNHAERVVGLLLRAGFLNQDISVLLPTEAGARNSAGHAQTPASSVTCANNGCVLGETLTLLKGLCALSISGLG